MKKICLDMDGVIADIMPVSCQIIEEWTGRRYNKYMINDWNLLENMDYGSHTRSDMFEETWNRWNDIPATERCIGGKVGELMLLGQVDIITSSDAHSVNNRMKWLAKYHIPYSKFYNIGHGKHKLNLDYDVFIDDAPYNAKAALEYKKSLLLYTQPFNVGREYPNPVTRIFSLSDARKVIKNGSY